MSLRPGNISPIPLQFILNCDSFFCFNVEIALLYENTESGADQQTILQSNESDI